MSEVVVEQVDRAVILLPQSMTDHQRESLASHDSRLNNLKLCLNTLNKLNLDQLLMDLANDVMQLFKVRMYWRSEMSNWSLTVDSIASHMSKFVRCSGQSWSASILKIAMNCTWSIASTRHSPHLLSYFPTWGCIPLRKWIIPPVLYRIHIPIYIWDIMGWTMVIYCPLRQASSWCTARSSQLWGAQFGHGRPSQLWSVTDQTFREPRFGSGEVRLAGQSDGQTMILWLDMIGFCTA